MSHFRGQKKNLARLRISVSYISLNSRSQALEFLAGLSLKGGLTTEEAVRIRENNLSP